MVDYATSLINAVKRIRQVYQPLFDRMPALLKSRRQLLKQDDNEPRRAREILESAAAQVPLNTRSIEVAASKFAHRTSTWQRVQMGRQTEAALGIDIQTADPEIAGLIDGFVHENVSLIKNLPSEVALRVERVVMQGTMKGQLWGDMARQLENQFAFGRNRAKLIAVDQIGKLYSNITKARHKEIGVGSYIWQTVNDERVRPEHRTRQGEKFSWKTPPSDGHPGEPIRCRCFPDPVFDDIFAELGKTEPIVKPPTVVRPKRAAKVKPVPVAPLRPPVVKPVPLPRVAITKPLVPSVTLVQKPTPIKLVPTVKPPRPGAERAGDIERAIGEVGGLDTGVGNPASQVIRDAFDGMVSKYGFHNSGKEAGFASQVETRDLPGAMGDYNVQNGKIRIRPDVLKKAKDFFRDLKNGVLTSPENVFELTDRLQSVRTIVHETIHGHGPRLSNVDRGAGLRVEEVVTEVAARKITREHFGFEKMPSLQVNISHGSYQREIDEMVSDIASIREESRDQATSRLELAAMKFKTRSDKFISIEEKVGAFVADLGLTGHEVSLMEDTIKDRGWVRTKVQDKTKASPKIRGMTSL
jgi:SPP1 gp7 family putative phage head morphogenesis protein